jgi:hypothetical protein
VVNPDRPADSEYAPFYAGYVGAVSENDVLSVLEGQPVALAAVAARIPAERERHRYAPGKWSLREVFGHLVDAERLFGYRAFRFGRRDATELSGFSENDFVARSRFDETPLSEHVEEFALTRRSHLAALRSLDAPGWEHLGRANGSPISTRALAFIMAGHVRHHLGVMAERYGVEV